MHLCLELVQTEKENVTLMCCFDMNTAEAQTLSELSTLTCAGHAGRLSVWWMWCYRSTKDFCCPIQLGIQAGISRLWMGLWCICAPGCLISANRKGRSGRPQLSADSLIVWGAVCWGRLCVPAWVCLPHPRADLSITGRGNSAVQPHLKFVNVCFF